MAGLQSCADNWLRRFWHTEGDWHVVTVYPAYLDGPAIGIRSASNVEVLLRHSDAAQLSAAVMTGLSLVINERDAGIIRDGVMAKRDIAPAMSWNRRRAWEWSAGYRGGRTRDRFGLIPVAEHRAQKFRNAISGSRHLTGFAVSLDAHDDYPHGEPHPREGIDIRDIRIVVSPLNGLGRRWGSFEMSVGLAAQVSVSILHQMEASTPTEAAALQERLVSMLEGRAKCLAMPAKGSSDDVVSVDDILDGMRIVQKVVA